MSTITSYSTIMLTLCKFIIIIITIIIIIISSSSSIVIVSLLSERKPKTIQNKNKRKKENKAFSYDFNSVSYFCIALIAQLRINIL